MPCHVGAWNSATTKSSSAKRSRRPIDANRPKERGPRQSRGASSSSAAARRDLRPPRCCGGGGFPGGRRRGGAAKDPPLDRPTVLRGHWGGGRRETGRRAKPLGF